MGQLACGPHYVLGAFCTAWHVAFARQVGLTGPPEAPLFAQQFFEAPLAVPRVGRCTSSSHSLLGPQDREAVVSISHSKNSIKIGNHKKVMEALNILSRVL